MLISIKTLQDDRFLRPLQHISGLFFEESTIGFEKEGANLIVDIQIEGNVMASACLTDVVTGNVYKQTFSKDLSSYGVEKERMKQVKHVVSYVYLSVLQQLTGIKQSWGILTGVRPTKLLHKMLQSGMSKEEAHKELRDSYLIDEEKIKLLRRIVDCQLSVIPDLYRLKEEVSIYIGIPFCPTKCAYCTFPAYAINGRQGSVDSFLGGLHYEIREIGAFLKEKGIKVTTIYYGGGTPTSITAEEMDMLYEQMYESFPNVENVREVTVEAGRPDTITPEKTRSIK